VNPAFEGMLAGRYLRAKKAESAISVTAWLALIAMALSVATLIVVMSVMNGFHDKLLSRILGLNGHIHIQYPGTAYGDIADDVRALPGVRAVVPLVEGQALASAGHGTAQGAMLRGIAPADFAQQEALAGAVVAGDLADFTGPAVAVGLGLARQMGLRVGGTLALTSPNMRTSPFGSIPRQGRYRVALLFETGMYEYDTGFVLMPLETAQRFAGEPGTVDKIDVFLSNIKDLDAQKAAVAAIVGERAQVYDWRYINKAFFDTLQLESHVMFLILSLIILISVFTIVATMVMLVKEKAPDIAVLRTMGASRGAVLRVFIAIGGAIGLIGTAAGALAGAAFAANIDTIRKGLERAFGVRLWDVEIRGLTEMPAIIDPAEVGAVAALSLVLSLAATLYPAWRAAKTDPVEVLRYG
jgi:lipoprotein-releasing system permease protein